jgi:predicted enzyme involved in methoxymalonyl-ACP biosynthesis
VGFISWNRGIQFWCMSRVTFFHEVFRMGMQDNKSGFRVLTGGGKKVIFLDLDNVFWGCIVGDVGWENLKI